MILRPEFTVQLARKLISGSSVNLISPHGQGRRRTLKDLKSILPQSLNVKQYDLRENQDDLEQGVCDFLNSKLTSLLILHNFNLLQNQDIVNLINGIKNAPNQSLLCVSETEDDAPLLDAENLQLPILTKPELLSEINTEGV